MQVHRYTRERQKKERESEFYLIKLTFIHAQGTYFNVNFDTHFIIILLSWFFEKAIMKWYMVRCQGLKV